MALGRQGFEEKVEERRAQRRRDRDAASSTRQLRHGDLALADGPEPGKQPEAAVAAGERPRKRRRKKEARSPQGGRPPR